MGGWGSGRRPLLHASPRRTVEECPMLPIGRLVKVGLKPGAALIHGQLVLNGSNQDVNSPFKIDFMIGPTVSEPLVVRLQYAVLGKTIQDTIQVAWDWIFGTYKQRTWFLCPVCGRRVRQLYLPPGELHFACRCCHKLSYDSRERRRLPWENSLDGYRYGSRRAGGSGNQRPRW